MFKRITVVTLLGAAMLLGPVPAAHSAPSCRGKVTGVKVDQTMVVIRINDVWHKLGDLTTPGIELRMKVALAAQLTGKEVEAGWPGSGYVCADHNYTVSADWIDMLEWY